MVMDCRIRYVALLPLAMALGLAILTLPDALAQTPARTVRPPPNALLSIDQNRTTVIERIIAEWGDELARSGVNRSDLRRSLEAMRADHLLAASLAGSLDGLLAIVASTADNSGAPIDKPASAAGPGLKALGDAADDLTYTPLTPCRIIDTRNAVGPLQPGVTRIEAGFSATTFAAQGGASTNCGIPAGVAALALNVVAVQPTNLGFIKLWPANASEPNASTINYDPTTTNIATGTIVPVDGANSNGFNAESPAQVEMVVDVVGYFAAPLAGGIECLQVAGPATSIAVSADTTVALPSCAAGYARTASSCSGTASVPSGYLVETNSVACVFRNLSAVATYSAHATSTCCRVSGR